MEVLTVIATLFMPLSVLAGFFPMNRFQPGVPLKAWMSRTAFWLMLVTMILAPLGAPITVRRRAWL